MTVALVIVSHSSQLAHGVAELASQMVQHKVPIVPAGGAGDEGETILGTSADKILNAISAVDNPDGILILLDLGSAILSAEMALEMLGELQPDHIRLSFAPLVEGTVAAAIEASLGHSLPLVQQAAEKTADRQQLQLLKPLQFSSPETEAETPTVPTLSSSPVTSADIRETHITITNPTGLHARPATLFVQTAGQFHASIEAAGHGRSTEATNIIGVLSLGIRQGDTLTLRATGPDADMALKALTELAQANFHETPPSGAIPTIPTPSSQPLSQPSPPPASQAAQGIAISKGVALGPALLYTFGPPSLTAIERRTIAPEQVASEQERLRSAIEAATRELHSLASRLQSQIGQADAAIFTAQALMLQDTTLLATALQQIAGQHSDAASALALAGEQQAAALAALDDPLLAARAVDIRDAVGRALQHITGQSAAKQDLSQLTSPVILLAFDLTPSDTAQLRPETILGICTVAGGPTAHAAILARALGIPAIAGLPENALLHIHSGDELGLDADNGLLYHFPTAEIRTSLQQRLATQQEQRAARQAAAQQTQAALQIDGRHIALLANVGSEAEARAARQWGAEGIGLLRTEFLFADAPSFPSVEEQRQHYIRIFQAFNGDTPSSKPIVVRTLDAGADKPMPALEPIVGTAVEANPALGLRGIRISLAHPQLLEQQLTALLQAAAETATNLHIMFPMITTLEELRTARAIFASVSTSVKRQHSSLPAHIPVGIMVEVPSAALIAPELAELADFFSIGANDLLQYTLACDRTNTSVAHLYHPMQPSVLRLIAHIAAAGRSAHKPVAVCGEIASDPRLAPVLIGLGIDELSMIPTAIPTVRTVLASRTSQELTQLAQKVLSMRTVAEVEQACDEFLQNAGTS